MPKLIVTVRGESDPVLVIEHSNVSALQSIFRYWYAGMFLDESLRLDGSVTEQSVRELLSGEAAAPIPADGSETIFDVSEPFDAALTVKII